MRIHNRIRNRFSISRAFGAMQAAVPTIEFVLC